MPRHSVPEEQDEPDRREEVAEQDAKMDESQPTQEDGSNIVLEDAPGVARGVRTGHARVNTPAKTTGSKRESVESGRKIHGGDQEKDEPKRARMSFEYGWDIEQTYDVELEGGRIRSRMMVTLEINMALMWLQWIPKAVLRKSSQVITWDIVTAVRMQCSVSTGEYLQVFYMVLTYLKFILLSMWH